MALHAHRSDDDVCLCIVADSKGVGLGARCCRGMAASVGACARCTPCCEGLLLLLRVQAAPASCLLRVPATWHHRSCLLRMRAAVCACCMPCGVRAVCSGAAAHVAGCGAWCRHGRVIRAYAPALLRHVPLRHMQAAALHF